MVYAEPTLYVCPACRKTMQTQNVLSYTVRSGTGPAAAPDLSKCPYCGAIFFLHNQWPKREDTPYNKNIPTNYRFVESPNLDDLARAEKLGLAKDKDEENTISLTIAKLRHGKEHIMSDNNKELFNKAKTLYEGEDYEQSVPLLQALANEGYAPAQNLLGDCFAFGRGTEQDLAEAFEWYGKAAEQDNADGQYNLGYCYYAGEGVEQDYSKAVSWFSKAAVMHEHARAQRQMGNCLLNGEGFTQNTSGAVGWFAKAAAQGDVKAMCSLGSCYYEGEGVELDFDKALEWFCKAAEQGDAAAQYNLGIYFYNGMAVEPDYAKAAEWFGKAAAQGYADAQEPLDDINAMEDDRRKVEELPKLEALANQGKAEDQYALAESLNALSGFVKDNFAKAVEWYRKAAEQGYAKAQYKLGLNYYHGWAGLEEDKTKAAEWFRRAADQGDADAQYEFGLCLYTGQGAEKNRDEAEAWFAKAVAYFSKAAEQGDSHSQNMLAICLDSGVGIAQDEDKAMEWWQKAAANNHYGAKKRLDMLANNPDDVPKIL